MYKLYLYHSMKIAKMYTLFSEKNTDDFLNKDKQITKDYYFKKKKKNLNSNLNILLFNKFCYNSKK